MDQLESHLSTRLKAESAQIFADEAYQDRVIAKVRTVRRTRQRRAWASGGAAVAIVLAGVTVVPILLSHSPTGSGPTSGHAGQGGNAIDWARELPEGGRPRLAYINDGFLHQREASIPVPGSAAELIGRTDHGWLIFVEHDNAQGQPRSSSYGILDAEGGYVGLPPDQHHGSVQVQALSPDGTLFAMGGTVLDLRSQQAVAEVPPDAAFASDWSTLGLVYADDAGAYHLWHPGTDPVPLNADFVAIADQAPVGVTATADGCSRVVSFDVAGALHEEYRACGSDRPVSVSPDGGYALTAGLNLVDMDTHTSLAMRDTPADVSTTWLEDTAWEDADRVLFWVIGPPSSRDARGQANGPRPVVLVRCDINTRTCERAGPEISLPAGAVLQLR